MKQLTTFFFLLTIISLCCITDLHAGDWITPDFRGMDEPQFKPVPLYWHTISSSPILYRKEITTPDECNRVTALAKSSGYLYIWVDGKRCFAYSVSEKTKPDPSYIHSIDLTNALSQSGKHILVISAPKDGFVLDGAFYDGQTKRKPLTTDVSWKVIKLPPTTIIEDDAALQPNYRGNYYPVEPGKPFFADTHYLDLAHRESRIQKLNKKVDDTQWRYQLMKEKGIYIKDGNPYWWGTPTRLSIEFPNQLQNKINSLQAMLEHEDSQSPLTNDEITQLSNDIDDVTREISYLSNQAWKQDESRMLALAHHAIYGKPLNTRNKTEQELNNIRSRLEKEIDHPLNRLNESRFDRLGWLPLPELSDGDINRWGIRINPLEGPTSITAPRRWIFMKDSQNTGEEEKRWSIGYNIEDQWPRIDVGKPWQESETHQNYTGAAWYRVRMNIPGEWAGNDVELSLSYAGIIRGIWINDHKLNWPDPTETTSRHSLRVPAQIINYGGENCIAVCIKSQNQLGGIVSPVELECFALADIKNDSTPPVDILSTPISPCAVLTPQTNTLLIHHSPDAQLLLPGKNELQPIDYEKKRDGALKENWAIIWLEPQTDIAVERPVMLVFSSNPLSIKTKGNQTRIVFNEKQTKLIALRPWTKSIPAINSVKLKTRIDFWRRAALYVPINYASITQLIDEGESINGININHIPQGPKIKQTIQYDYFELNDEWATNPIKIAPLPTLCSYGVDTGFETLSLNNECKIIHDGQVLAPYRAVLGNDHVSYQYRIEPFPRRAGFTSWMFGGADVGVRGNYREMELIAAAGANSYRPQHNFSDDPSPHYQGHTRLEVLFDACMRYGINYTNNIDQTLGESRQYVREHYNAFIDKVIRHYEYIAGQLHENPFWAVGYDLINEPFDHHHTLYNPAIKRLTKAIREIDPVHLLYIEPCESWGAIQQLLVVEPTCDPLTVYSYHDYNFRLNEKTDRWPTLDRDMTDICRMWLPAFQYMVMHSVPLHCGEFGDFRNQTFQIDAEVHLLNDFMRFFDQFAMHFHYYSGRSFYAIEQDGSLTPSNITRTYRRYFKQSYFNRYYQDQLWPGHPVVTQYQSYSRPAGLPTPPTLYPSGGVK